MKDFKLAIFLLGPPGSGKTTQAEFLAKEFSLAVIDGGEILRRKFTDRKQTVGEAEARTAYESGQLVDPGLMLEWLREAIEKHKTQPGLVFPGSLRTEYEAKRLPPLLKNKGYLVLILEIKVSAEESIKRNSLRHRDETDALKKIKTRLRVYQEEIKPLNKSTLHNKIISINGEQTSGQVFESLRQKIRKRIGNERRRAETGKNNKGAIPAGRARN